ncbi:hypothetical protein PISMIDRAFT_18868 [Pisolithus microcarpus 441]|uniref:Uncharacterized protein n=1 Tax=Pisolithus microcarpus 441 TaxID=765257 RepID=A0A0C9XIV5_9AGAM|nr:hypothetical protein PISMIDRAFT_18868 [Pisolithus microcarpus 441]
MATDLPYSDNEHEWLACGSAVQSLVNINIPGHRNVIADFFGINGDAVLPEAGESIIAPNTWHSGLANRTFKDHVYMTRPDPGCSTRQVWPCMYRMHSIMSSGDFIRLVGWW